MSGADVEALLMATVLASPSPEEDVLDELMALFDAVGPPLRPVVSRALASCLDRAVAAAWSHGWQPADVTRYVERELGDRHGRLMLDAIASEARSYLGPGAAVDPSWADQLGAIGADLWWDEHSPHLEQRAARERVTHVDAWRWGTEILAVLVHLPTIPRLCPPPREWGTGCWRQTPRHGGQSKMLGRVRALLAKAESTSFPEEAEALSAKAQELMARHAIDVAMVDATGETGERPVSSRVGVDAPYAQGKAHLLSEIAVANRCRAVWSKQLGFSTIFGFAPDLDAVELLYTSLLVQARTAMMAAGRDLDSHGRSRTRSFRSSFMAAYAIGIGERLQAAVASETVAATEAHGSALLPVLASRADAVDGACVASFPELSQGALRIANRMGWVAGRAAAELASLSVYEQVTVSSNA